MCLSAPLASSKAEAREAFSDVMQLHESVAAAARVEVLLDSY